MKLIKNLTIFTAGGLLYGIVEILWRGGTHISMFLVGGLCFYIIGSLDEGENKPCILSQAAMSCVIVTSIEFSSGVFINMILNLGVWDYSSLPFNVMGQICLPFSILWLFISVPAIYAEDALRSAIFGEPQKRLTLLPAVKKKTAIDA